jgi:hypothetical protein
LQTLSNAFGLDSDSLLSEYEALRPSTNKFAKQAPNALDCSARSWKNALALVAGDARRVKHFPSSNLRQVLSRFVAYVGSSSGVEQTFSQCLSQFRHRRHFSDLGIQRIVVLAGTQGQSEEADNKLHARARLIWAETSPQQDVEQTLTSRRPEATKRATAGCH